MRVFLSSIHNLNVTNILYDAVQSPVVSSIDELEDFAMGRARNSADVSLARNNKEMRQPQSAKAGRYKEAEHASRRTPKKSVDELESFFSAGSRSSSVPRSRVKTLVSTIDIKVHHFAAPRIKLFPSFMFSRTLICHREILLGAQPT